MTGSGSGAASLRNFSLSPAVFRSSIPLVVLELLNDTSNISRSPSASLKGPQRSILILEPNETADLRFERLVKDLNRHNVNRKLPIKPVNFIEPTATSGSETTATLVQSINQFRPKLSGLSISGYEMISKSIASSFRRNQLLEYVNYQYSEALFKGTKKRLLLRPKKKLIDIIIQDIWHVKKTDQVSSLDDVLVTESVGLSNLDLFLLLLQNGVIIQHLSGAVSEISFDSNERKIIFRGTNKQVENAKINLSLDLQNSHREEINLKAIKHLFREKYNEFSLAKIGKNTEVHFSHLGDDIYELAALNHNQLKRTKRLLLWLLDYNMHIKQHLVLPESTEGLSLVPYKDDDALSWDNRAQEFFVLKGAQKKPSERFLKELEKFSDENLSAADFDYEDFLEEAKSIPLRRTNLIDKRRDPNAFLLLRSIGINTDVRSGVKREGEEEVSESTGETKAAGSMGANAQDMKGFPDDTDVSREETETLTDEVFSEKAELSEDGEAFLKEVHLSEQAANVPEWVGYAENIEKLSEERENISEDRDSDETSESRTNHEEVPLTEASEATKLASQTPFSPLSEATKADLFSKLTDFSYRSTLSGVKQKHLNPPVFTVTFGNILFNGNQSQLEDEPKDVVSAVEKLLPSGPSVELLKATSNYKFSTNVELISDRVLALPALGVSEGPGLFANEDPHTYSIQMKFLPSPFGENSAEKDVSEQMKYPPVEIWVDLNQRQVADISSMQVVTVEGENIAYVAQPDKKVDLRVCCQISGDVLREDLNKKAADSGDIDSILTQTAQNYKQFLGQPGVGKFLNSSKLDFSGREPTSIEQHIDLVIGGVPVRYHYVNVSYRRKLHLVMEGKTTPVEFNVVEGGSLGGRKVEVNFIGEVGDISKEAFDRVVDDAVEFAGEL